MKVLLTGATGYVGGHIGKKLVELGHEVVSLTRNKKQEINFKTKLIEMKGLSSEEGIEAVIHLAGASIADQRWTKDYKRILKSSRVAFTHQILRELNYDNLQVFLQASATGYYSSSADRVLTEESHAGQGFLSKLCVDWEEATENLDCRKAYFRMGMVIGKNSPVMKKMTTVFNKGLGAALGNGRQYMSLVHIDDLVTMFVAALEDYKYSDVYNAVSPSPVTNETFTDLMAKSLQKKIFLPAAPSFVLKLMYGEMSQVLLDSHRVEPKRLKEQSFEFKYTELEEALRSSI